MNDTTQSCRLSDDYADISAIHDALNRWNSQRSGDPFREIRAPIVDGQMALVACDADGGAHGGLVFHWMTEKPACLFIDYLFLDDAMRGHGNGARLMETFLSWARSHEAAAVEVTSNSFQAPEFYKRMGFAVTGSVPSPCTRFPDNLHYSFRREL